MNTLESVILIVGIGMTVMLGIIAYYIKDGIRNDIRVEYKVDEKPKKKAKRPKKTKKVERKQGELEKIESFASEKEAKAEPKKAEPPSLYGEIWKPLVEPVPARSNHILPYYMVSNMGRVWNNKLGIMLNQQMLPTGLVVNVNREEKGSSQRFVKNLVATAFIAEQNIYVYHVVHRDGNPRNCLACNLRWEKIKKTGNHTNHKRGERY